MTRDAARRSSPILAIISFVVITAAACSGITLPGQSTSTGSGPGASLPGASIGTAADLEAMLPAQLCGQPSKKSSLGAGLQPSTGTESPNPFGELFGTLGATGSAQVAVAIPTDETTCKVSVGAFRLTGANQAILQGVLSMMAAQSGGEVTNTNVGGKTVIKVVEDNDTTYVYIKGDVIFAVAAPGDDLAAPALSALP